MSVFKFINVTPAEMFALKPGSVTVNDVLLAFATVYALEPISALPLNLTLSPSTTEPDKPVMSTTKSLPLMVTLFTV